MEVITFEIPNTRTVRCLYNGFLICDERVGNISLVSEELKNVFGKRLFQFVLQLFVVYGFSKLHRRMRRSFGNLQRQFLVMIDSEPTHEVNEIVHRLRGEALYEFINRTEFELFTDSVSMSFTKSNADPK